MEPSVESSLNQELCEVVEAIFESMLGFPLSRGNMSPAADRLHATITFAGSWTGMIAIDCQPGLAREFAAHYLSFAPGEITEQVASDTLGELANMIAGNLKAIFAHDLRLSPASVSQGDADPGPSFLPVVSEHVCFDCLAGPFCVTVLAAPADSRPLEPSTLDRVQV